MNITFHHARFLVSGIKFNPGVDYATLLAELQQEDWTAWNADVPMGHENNAWSLRYRLNKIKSPLLVSIREYLQSSEVYDLLLDSLYDFGPLFQGLWSVNKDQMREWAIFHMEYMKDLPGFTLNPHNDYRRLIGAGIIYLNEKDDPNIATTLYSDRQLSNPMVMTTNFGDGWFAVNEYCNWHGGCNHSNYDRYSILIGLTIKLPEDYVRK